MQTELTDTELSGAQAIVEYSRKLGDAQLLDLKAGTIVALPEGRTVSSLKEYLDEYLPKPERKKGTAILTTLNSFMLHVKREKLTNTAVFVDDRDKLSPKMIAVYDYNEAGTGDAQFGQHRAIYPFPTSEEWRAWMSITDKPLSQEKFAEFLEERLVDVVDPTKASDLSAAIKHITDLDLKLATPNQLLELSRGLQINVESKVVSQVNLASGEKAVSFEEKHDVPGKQMKVPGGFAIGIPVFDAGDVYPIAVRLRYRMDGGKLIWRLVPHRPDVVFRMAIGGACSIFETVCGFVPFNGVPES